MKFIQIQNNKIEIVQILEKKKELKTKNLKIKGK
jgi:hypothetical protein